ncbi:MAG: hypothetical protein MI754_07275 [Chromatiales bacterium]|nr:hypothetical protein [Chromatiales bacterium]
MHIRNLRLEKIAVGILLAATGGIAQAVDPSDPLYQDTPIPPLQFLYPNQYQWGLRALNLEQVWDYSRGHSYLASVDTGVQTNHPDLQNNFRPQFSQFQVITAIPLRSKQVHSLPLK